MTNQERIQSHNTRLAAMKETITGLPETGGEAAVETCTVTITKESGSIDDIVATRLINGTIITELCYTGNVMTLDNVVVGTTITILSIGNVYYIESGGVIEFYDNAANTHVFTVSGDGTITIRSYSN